MNMYNHKTGLEPALGPTPAQIAPGPAPVLTVPEPDLGTAPAPESAPGLTPAQTAPEPAPGPA